MRSLILVALGCMVCTVAMAQASPRADVNGDGSVTAADLAAVRRHLGQPVTDANARYDVNGSGTLNALDLLAVRAAMAPGSDRAAERRQQVPVHTTFSVQTWPGRQASAQVRAGEDIDLAVEMATNDMVGGVVFDVALPVEGWTRVYHELGDHGWYENDPIPPGWDCSVPRDPTTPVVINAGTYAGADPVPDFHISTAYDPVGTAVTGTVPVVTCRLSIPGTTPDGAYLIGLRHVEAGDTGGAPLGNVSAGPDFVLQVSNRPVLSWAGEPGFLRDGCDPNVGEAGVTLFQFKVKLTDVDGDEPDRVRLVLRRDGKPWQGYRLRAESGSLETGRIYAIQLGEPLPPGRYEYRFRARDADGWATGAPTVRHPGPSMSPKLFFLSPPGLADGVRPNTGMADDTKFLWAVGYQDNDGDWPEYVRVGLWRDGARYRAMRMVLSGSSTDVVAGVVYHCRRRLPAGSYEYQFTAADRDGRAIGSATARMAGLLVSDGAPLVAIAGPAATPTRAGAQITFSLSAPAEVGTRIVNIAGRPVRTLCRAMDCEAGTNTLLWNARSDQGLAVPNGTYLIEVTAKAADGTQARALGQVRVRR